MQLYFNSDLSHVVTTVVSITFIKIVDRILITFQLYINYNTIAIILIIVNPTTFVTT